jgi:hypothetical protein
MWVYTSYLDFIVEGGLSHRFPDLEGLAETVGVVAAAEGAGIRTVVAIIFTDADGLILVAEDVVHVEHGGSLLHHYGLTFPHEGFPGVQQLSDLLVALSRTSVVSRLVVDADLEPQ